MKYMKSRILIFGILACLLASCTKHEFRTEQITYNKTTILPSSPSDSLVVNIEIEYPVDMEDTEVLQLIQQDLLRALLDQEVDVAQGEEAVVFYAHKFEEGYLQTFASDKNDSVGVDCWENIITGRVMSVRNNILSYSDERYVFLGGPHGINSRHFYNYDITTGKYLTESDLFKHDYTGKLTDLLIENLIGQYEEFESRDDIVASDFRLEDIKPNGNFYFTEDEMIYVFNPYEIAPYYVGETEIAIPLVQIQDLLLPTVKILPL